MRLLVSVSNASEAAAAFAGGADVIDAKDPFRGALGAVTRRVFGQIRGAVTRPTSAALGDAVDADTVECDARSFRAAGASFVKIGFAGIDDRQRVTSLLRAATRGAGAGVIAVAYADAKRVGAASPDAVLDAAIRAGATGVLIDTADKAGASLPALMPADALSAWIGHAHAAGLIVAVAGKLLADDLPAMAEAGADIAGVRSAACDGGRTGTVSTERVRRLRMLCGSSEDGPAEAGHYVRER